MVKTNRYFIKINQGICINKYDYVTMMRKAILIAEYSKVILIQLILSVHFAGANLTLLIEKTCLA